MEHFPYQDGWRQGYCSPQRQAGHRQREDGRLSRARKARSSDRPNRAAKPRQHAVLPQHLHQGTAGEVALTCGDVKTQETEVSAMNGARWLVFCLGVALLLQAGCGSGVSDAKLRNDLKQTGLAWHEYQDE